MVTTETKLTLPDQVMFRDLAGEAVLLDLESGRYYGLNESGTRMWSLLVRHGRIGLALRDLLQEYDVPSERLEKDLLLFVETLASRKLLHLHEEIQS
jgi:hypothetical protein